MPLCTHRIMHASLHTQVNACIFAHTHTHTHRIMQASLPTNTPYLVAGHMKRQVLGLHDEGVGVVQLQKHLCRCHLPHCILAPRPCSKPRLFMLPIGFCWCHDRDGVAPLLLHSQLQQFVLFRLKKGLTSEELSTTLTARTVFHINVTNCADHTYTTASFAVRQSK